jgi:hypothetical protein
MSFHKIAPVKKQNKPADKCAGKAPKKPVAKKPAAPKQRPVSRQGR